MMAVPINQHKIAVITDIRNQMGEKFPRIALSVVAYNAQSTLSEVMKRIPEVIYDLIEEIFIFDDHSDDSTYEIGSNLIADEKWGKVRLYRNPIAFQYGGNQKLAIEYCLSKKYDYLVLMHADGNYAPEYLPDLILAAIEKTAQVVIGSRVREKLNPLQVRIPWYKWWGVCLLSRVQSFLLHEKLADFHCGYRLYGARFLSQIAYLLNSDDYHFDTQILIQAHVLQEPITEVPVPLYNSNELQGKRGVIYALNSLWAIIQFRLHQLGLFVRKRYDPVLPVQYAFKDFSHSSHRRIFELVHEGECILDLGCGDGSLALKLKEKGCHVTGVDLLEPLFVQPGLDRYVKWDLTDEQDLPFEREFDCVILGDIVEHLVDGAGLMLRARKILREGGRLIISTPNIALWVYRAKHLAGRFDYDNMGVMDRTHVHFYTLKHLLDDLNLTGYKVTGKYFTSIPFQLVITLRPLKGLAEILARGYFGLVRLWPRFFAYQFVLQARIRRLEWMEMRHWPDRLSPPHPHLGDSKSKTDLM